MSMDTTPIESVLMKSMIDSCPAMLPTTKPNAPTTTNAIDPSNAIVINCAPILSSFSTFSGTSSLRTNSILLMKNTKRRDSNNPPVNNRKRILLIDS